MERKLPDLGPACLPVERWTYTCERCGRVDVVICEVGTTPVDPRKCIALPPTSYGAVDQLLERYQLCDGCYYKFIDFLEYR